MSEESMVELRSFCRENGDAIYVRTLKDGRWGSYPLSSLPEDAQEGWVQRWHGEGRRPVVLR